MTDCPTSASQAARTSLRKFLLHGVTVGVGQPVPLEKSVTKYWYMLNGIR